MMPVRPQKLALGIDVGTSGVRIAAVDKEGQTRALSTHAFAAGEERSSPAAWWRGVEACFKALAGQIDLRDVGAVAVDGTSGTVLALDESL